MTPDTKPVLLFTTFKFRTETNLTVRRGTAWASQIAVGDSISLKAREGEECRNAVVTGQQQALGSLSPGKLADLVVLDRDIFNIDIDEVLGTQVLMTVFDGRVVYEKE